MKSAEFGTFPCHTLPNTCEFLVIISQLQQNVLPPYETVFCELCKKSVSKRKNQYVASKSNVINLWFNSLPGVYHCIMYMKNPLLKENMNYTIRNIEGEKGKRP